MKIKRKFERKKEELGISCDESNEDEDGGEEGGEDRWGTGKRRTRKR